VLPVKSTLFLSKRQQRIKELMAKNGWTFDPAVIWSKSRFRKFRLFETRPLEFSKNRMQGTFKSSGINWEIFDITFDEGAFLAREVHHTTALLVSMGDQEIPTFEIEREGWLSRILEFAFREEVVFDDPKFTEDFAVKGSDPDAVRRFFTEDIIAYLTENSRFHIEGNANGLLVFKSFRFASAQEVKDLIEFTEGLVRLVNRRYELEPVV
jgi:hypothetical protein